MIGFPFLNIVLAKANDWINNNPPPARTNSTGEKLINHFLGLMGREWLGFVQEILETPPVIQAEVGIFFKEAHRFEQRKKGCNHPFFEALNVRWLLVSLPAVDLSKRYSLLDRQRKSMNTILAGSN